jgi:hypothetical protein
MSESPSPIEMLAEARNLADLVAASLPQKVDAAALTSKSKLPFKVISIRELLFHRVSALASPAVVLFEQGSYVAGVVLTRAVVETVAIIFAIHKQLRSFEETKDVDALDDFLMNCLMASRWKDATYQARNILTFVDYVDKEMPGFRATYDSLSEYSHPNWSGVLGAFGEIDQSDYALVLGPNERTTVFVSGVSALSGSLLTMQHFYNDMVKMLYQLNEYFETKGGDEA